MFCSFMVWKNWTAFVTSFFFFGCVLWCGVLYRGVVLWGRNEPNQEPCQRLLYCTLLYPTTLTPTLLYFTMRMGGNYTVNLNSAKPRYFLFLCNVLMYGKNSESTTFPDTEEAWRRYSLPLLCGIKNPVWETL